MTNRAFIPTALRDCRALCTIISSSAAKQHKGEKETVPLHPAAPIGNAHPSAHQRGTTDGRKGISSPPEGIILLGMGEKVMFICRVSDYKPLWFAGSSRKFLLSKTCSVLFSKMTHKTAASGQHNVFCCPHQHTALTLHALPRYYLDTRVLRVPWSSAITVWSHPLLNDF